MFKWLVEGNGEPPVRQGWAASVTSGGGGRESRLADTHGVQQGAQ